MSELARQAARHAQKMAVESIAPSVDAALKNELITRQRVDALEQWAHRFSTMGRWERFKWLFMRPVPARIPVDSEEKDVTLSPNDATRIQREAV